MTELIKKSSYFDVNSTSKSSLKIEGHATISDINNSIQNLSLSFLKLDKVVGSVNYSEFLNTTSYSYNINDESKKTEIMSLTDEIILDIKTLITK